MLAIFGFIAFDYDLRTLEEDHKTGSNELAEALEVINNAFQLVTYAPRWLSILYLKLSSRHQRAKKLVEQYLYRIIEQEMNESPELRAQRKRTSLIASLVGSIPFDEKNEATKREEEKTGLSRQEVLNEMLLFLNAGSDTTATAITWFIHLVSKHPRVQEKIKAELIANDAASTLSLSHLDSLVYLDCAINEVLRFCPPISGTLRTLTTDDRLPKSGIRLYKGDSVLIPFHNLSHDRRYWSIDPEKFYPERFLGEDKNHPTCALIPFGSGHRHCIGEDFARFKLKVIIARLMQQVTFGDGGPKLNAGGHSSQVTIVPKKVGVTFTIT
ncbi:unnamed protein product [Rotaria sp. Silwood2]|nr:unnamed protein product [Rotaria sp. Silwood2]